MEAQCTLALLHLQALDHIATCCGEMGRPPPGLTASVALRVLQADASCESLPTVLAPLSVDLLSLPDVGPSRFPSWTCLVRWVTRA